MSYKICVGVWSMYIFLGESWRSNYMGIIFVFALQKFIIISFTRWKFIQEPITIHLLWDHQISLHWVQLNNLEIAFALIHGTGRKNDYNEVYKFIDRLVFCCNVEVCDFWRLDTLAIILHFKN